ncbi:MAG: GGDEF domain-containing protein [Acidobacteriota bacterium]|nr:GGDEF domain-containing protein [Acidobacteriota bacterium]
MADWMPPGGDSGNPGHTGASRPVRAEEVGGWTAQWRSRLPDDPRIPEDEARMVVEAVLQVLAGSGPEPLDRAGRAWARAHRSVAAMVGRLSSLREAFAVVGVEEPLEMHRAVDRITAAATEEVLTRLERASRTDALTGVGNRRAFDETLSSALSAASRRGHQVTVVAVDLDGLKLINDTEGHAAGDAALLALVRALYSARRDEDSVFRVGGDEFVILLPFTSVDAAELFMRRVQAAGGPAFTWGAAGYPDDGADAPALVEAADRDLYRRRQGRRPPSSRPVPAGPGIPAAARWLGRDWRWLSVPAAAVVAAVVAVLFSAAGTRGPARVAGPHHHGGPNPATAPSSSAHPGGSTPGGSPTASTGSSPGTPALSVATSPAGAPAGGAPTGGGGAGGSGGPGPGGSGPPPAPPGSPANGGLLGTLEQDLAPVPVVGGRNGLLATLGQLLTGSSTASAGTLAPAGTPSAGSPSAVAPVPVASPATALNAASSTRLLP